MNLHLRPLEFYLSLNKQLKNTTNEQLQAHKEFIARHVIQNAQKDLEIQFNTAYGFNIDTSFSFGPSQPFLLTVDKANPDSFYQTNLPGPLSHDEILRRKKEARSKGYDVEYFDASEESSDTIIIRDTITCPYRFFEELGHEMLHRYARESGMLNYIAAESRAELIQENLADFIGIEFANEMVEEYHHDPLGKDLLAGQIVKQQLLQEQRMVTLTMSLAHRLKETDDTLNHINEICNSQYSPAEIACNRLYSGDWKIQKSLETIKEFSQSDRLFIDFVGTILNQTQLEQTALHLKNDFKREEKEYLRSMKMVLEAMVHDPIELQRTSCNLNELYRNANNIIRFHPGTNDELVSLLQSYIPRTHDLESNEAQNLEHTIGRLIDNCTHIYEVQDTFKLALQKRKESVTLIRHFAQGKKGDLPE